MQTNAQKVNSFQKIFGSAKDDAGCSIIELKDRGYLFAGTTTSFGAGGMDILVVRMDSLGKIIWSKTYGGADNEGSNSFLITWSVDLIQTPDSNFVLCTNTLSFGAGGRDIYLIKIDKNGNVIWNHTYGGGADDAGYGIMNDPRGGLIIVGETGSYGSGNLDFFLMKTDTAGNVIWANAYGSSLEERGYRVYPSYDGGFLVSGVVNNTDLGYAYDQVVMKTDSVGKLLWSKVYGNLNYDLTSDIIELPDHSIYVTGSSDTTNAGSAYRATLLKFNNGGKLLWCKAWRSGNFSLRNILYDKKNNWFNIQGFWHNSSSIQDLYLMRTDTTGKPQFLKTYGPLANSGYSVGGGHSLIPLSNRGMAFLGLESSFGFGNRDVYFLKMDSNANTNSCSVTNQSFSYTRFVMADHSYPFATTSFKPIVGQGITVTTPVTKDSLLCPPFVANFSYQLPCSGYKVKFFDNTYKGAKNWKWDFGDVSSGLNSSTLSNPTHIFTTAGTYTVRLIAGNGIEKDTISEKITISSFQLHSITIDTTICQNKGILLKAPEQGNSYLWNISNADSTKASSMQYPSQNSVFTVRISNGTGCVVYDTINVTVIKPVIINLGADRYICNGDSVILTINLPDSVKTIWQDSSTAKTFIAKAPGIYWAESEANCGKYRDSVTITRLGPPIIPIRDTILCGNAILTYTLALPLASYQWSTGNTSSSVTINKSGKYWVVAKNQCAKNTDTFLVTFIPFSDIKLPSDTFVCLGDTLRLNVFQPGASYLWQDGSTSPVFTVRKAGLYAVVSRNGICTSTDSIRITQLLPPQVFLGNDTSFCLGDTFSYRLNRLTTGTAIQWQDHTTKTVMHVTNAGKYFVTLSNACGIASDTVNVNLTDCSCQFFVPNVFTPNADTLNSIFIPIGCPHNLESYNLSIYNRWGELIFNTSDRNLGWDGKFRGMPCIEGVYLYLVNYKARFGHDELLDGTVTLLR